MAFEATGRMCLCLLIDFIFEELNSLNEGARRSGHDHIYGIEVLTAVKTSGEIGFWVDCGMEVSAQGTSEPEQVVRGSGLHVQEGSYDRMDGDLISEHFEEILWEVGFCHEEYLLWH